MIARLMWPLILLQVAAVATIIFFLRMFLHKQLEIGLKRIKKLDQENLRKETELNKRLQSIDKECMMKLGEAEKEAKLMIEAAKEEAKKMREDERIKAKEETKRIIAGAIQQKDKLLKEMEYETFNRALDFAVVILRRIFSEENLKTLRCKVSREVIDALVGSKKIEELSGRNEDIDIITADSLPEADRRYVTKSIERKFGKKAKIKFTVDKNTLGGITLRIGEEIIDGSIAYRVNKAALEMKEKGINSA